MQVVTDFKFVTYFKVKWHIEQQKNVGWNMMEILSIGWMIMKGECCMSQITGLASHFD